MSIVMAIPQTVADLLRDYRSKAGKTQEELCRVTGLSGQTISRIERGDTRSPDLETIAKIALALGPYGDAFKADVDRVAKQTAIEALEEERAKRDHAKG